MLPRFGHVLLLEPLIFVYFVQLNSKALIDEAMAKVDGLSMESTFEELGAVWDRIIPVRLEVIGGTRAVENYPLFSSLSLLTLTLQRSACHCVKKWM